MSLFLGVAVCYAKGRIFIVGFFANNMRNVGAVISQLVTVWGGAVITSCVTSWLRSLLGWLRFTLMAHLASISRSVSCFHRGISRQFRLLQFKGEQRVLTVLHHKGVYKGNKGF